MDTPEPSSPPRAVGIRPWRVLRDVGITYGLSLLGGFVIGIISAMKEQPASMIAIAVSNILCSVAGFTLAGYFTPENLIPSVERADRLKPLVPESSSMPEMALRFILSNRTVSTIIPGMRKIEHVESNIAASDKGALPEDLIRELKKHAWIRKPAPWSD